MHKAYDFKGIAARDYTFLLLRREKEGTRYRNFVQNHPVMNVVYKQVD
jgi:hypothetical protein